MGYTNAVGRAYDTLFVTQNGTLPIDPFATIRNRGWNLFTYSQFATDVNDLKSVLNISKDAFSFFSDGNYTIVYNEHLPENEQRFALAHEIAHIELEHFHNAANTLQFTKDSLRHPSNYKNIEHEANTYAYSYLCPASLLNICKFTMTELQKIFKIPAEAAAYVLLHMNEDLDHINAKTDAMIKEMYIPALRPHYFYPYHEEA